tara:strand:+ start:62 stop:925 length:864 start_codon:yes stop_codon:yes gene_type:complete
MDNKQISVHIMGGLGNQLFQIVSCMAYSIKYKRKMILPYFEYIQGNPIRLTYWNNLLQPLKRFTTYGRENISNTDLQQFVRYNEPNFHYNEIPDISNINCLLYGYYQSYKYFQEFQSQFFDLIQLTETQNKIKNEYMTFDNNIKYTSMHFRIGDYIDKQICHPLLSEEYYDKSIEYLLSTKETEDLHILYFCEEKDNNIVKKVIDNLSLKYSNVTFTKVDDKYPDWVQLIIMSCCNNNIIANSSYSWWGAYFNQNPNKIVCFPSKWFGPALKNNNIIDLCPNEWYKI